MQTLIFSYTTLQSINVAAMQRDFDNSTATRRLCTARKTMGPYRNRQSLAPHKRSRLSTTRRPTASAHKLRTAIRPKSRWTAYTGHADESADEDELQFLGFVPGHQTVYGSPGGPQSEPVCSSHVYSRCQIFTTEHCYPCSSQ